MLTASPPESKKMLCGKYSRAVETRWRVINGSRLGVVVDAVADRVVSTGGRSENEALFAAALSERGYKRR